MLKSSAKETYSCKAMRRQFNRVIGVLGIIVTVAIFLFALKLGTVKAYANQDNHSVKSVSSNLIPVIDMTKLDTNKVDKLKRLGINAIKSAIKKSKSIVIEIEIDGDVIRGVNATVQAFGSRVAKNINQNDDNISSDVKSSDSSEAAEAKEEVAEEATDSNTLTVGPDSAYTTISQAVAAASDGTTIFIKNGTYTESVKIKKNLTLVGESAGGVILQYPCDSYYYPPLEAHCGRFENLVIKAYGNDLIASGSKAYAVHCEKLMSLSGSTISFDNCTFESSGNWDVGMGGSNGFVASFSNCTFNGKGMFYHSYGKFTGEVISSTINISGCVFSQGTAFEIQNLYAETSLVNVNIKKSDVNLGLITSYIEGVGSAPLYDDALNAKNIIWNIN